MSRLTLNLPESLHQKLREQAEREGVPLAQFLLDSLTRLVSAADLGLQRAAFEGLLAQYPPEEAEEVLQTLLANRQPS